MLASALIDADLDAPRQNPLATLDAIRRLDLHLVACEGSVARGMLRRAIQHLELDLLQQFTGRRVGRRVAEGRVA